jgi:hypothetical protein
MCLLLQVLLLRYKLCLCLCRLLPLAADLTTQLGAKITYMVAVILPL